MVDELRPARLTPRQQVHPIRREAMRPLVPDDPPDPRNTVLRFDEEAVRVGKAR